MSKANKRRGWRTSITDASASSVKIRGYDLWDLAEKQDFAGTFYLLVTGELPEPKQARILNALLINAADRGIAPSTAITRTIVSCGVPLQAAVAAGIISFGDHHGGVGIAMGTALKAQVEKLGDNPSEDDLAQAAHRFIASFRDRGERIAGFGQPLHPEGDPRARKLIAYAQRLGVEGNALKIGLTVEKEIVRVLGRSLPMNVDGAIACIALDIGLPPEIVRAINFIGRAAGLSAHALEEARREPVFRLLADDDEVVYDGPPPRQL